MLRNKTHLLFVALLASFMAVTGVDWFLRFYWYGWHNRLLVLSVRGHDGTNSKALKGQGAPMVMRTIPEHSGGNLSRLMEQCSVCLVSLMRGSMLIGPCSQPPGPLLNVLDASHCPLIHNTAMAMLLSVPDQSSVLVSHENTK